MRACLRCPWEAIYPEDDVPEIFEEDIALNAVSMERRNEFHVPVERLARRAEDADAVRRNKARWGLVERLRA